ncbi:hypothetical protein FJT64_016389 [Amphibalanus amphitrite]|uniref:EB domain-containing protein n=1 Tax=Amphibalanus amphitrite TaxID=1232801 RepID=A0A6A4XEZ5_AMPAM|nr:hypothetical protein FJT64_016389 [Amphibalanus amphitrite]
MASRDCAPPRPLAPLAGALVICCLLGVGQALPQGTSAAETPALGSTCAVDLDCDPIAEAVCLNTTCQCPTSHPIANGNECLPVSGLDGYCTVNAQCKPHINKAQCSSNNKCVCIAKHKMHKYNDGTRLCIPTAEHIAEAKKTPVDPVMIAILVSLVLMFLIICIVLQLFSKARFRQNRTILNSANPRLMNSSFLKGSTKLGSAGGRGRRASRGSLNTVPEGEQDKTDGAGAERTVGSGSGSGSGHGSGSDPVSEGQVVPLPPLRAPGAAARVPGEPPTGHA